MKTKCMLPILLAIIMSFSITAYTPSWSIDFTNHLDNYTDTFSAGAGPLATDGYDPSADVQQPPATPSGAFIQMRTLVDQNILTVDNRADLQIETPKTWEITLIAMNPDYTPLSGQNILTWPDLSAMSDLNIQLIDYGTDSTRTNIIATIDPKQQTSYEFDVTSALGPYRYIDLIVESTVCIENWDCTDWSDCKKKSQDRTCTDLNSCGTTNQKPEETQTCKPGGGPSSGGDCTPKWKCTKWSKCVEDEKTRECTDQRKCGDDSSKPDETEACISEKGSAQKTPVQLTGEETTEQTTTTEKSDLPQTPTTELIANEPKTNVFVGISIIIAIVSIGLAIFFVLGKK